MEEVFIEKPEGKPVKAFRARVKMYGNDVVVVNPMEPRESSHQRGCERSRPRSHHAGAFCRAHQGRAEERAEAPGKGQAAP